jgi:hypothetical protein
MAGLLGQRLKTASRRFNSLLGGVIPADNAGGLLGEQEAQAAQRQAQLMMASSLLQSSGPSQMPTSFGQALGSALPQALQAQQQGIDVGLDRQMFPLQKQLLEAQIAQAGAPGKPQLGTITLESNGKQRTLRQGDPEVDALLQQGWTEVRTPAAQVNVNSGPNLPSAPSGQGYLPDPSSPFGFRLADIPGAVKPPDELDQPVPVTELSRLRAPDGSSLPMGTTRRQAQEIGAVIVSEAAQQRSQQVKSALGMLEQLKGMQSKIDESGVIRGVGSNVLARLANGLGNAIGALIGTDSAETRTVFKDLSRGTIAPLIRALGESGSLSDGDVNRALDLLPDNAGWVPDSTTLANDKLLELEQIFKRAAENLGTNGSEIDNDPLGLRK